MANFAKNLIDIITGNAHERFYENKDKQERERQQKIKSNRVYVPKDGYASLRSKNTLFRSYTISAFVVLGLIRVSNKQADIAGSVPKASVKDLIGRSAFNHWSGGSVPRLAIFDDKVRITKTGLAVINDSLQGKGRGYNADCKLIPLMTDVIRNGGVLNVYDKSVNFDLELLIQE